MMKRLAKVSNIYSSDATYIIIHSDLGEQFHCWKFQNSKLGVFYLEIDLKIRSWPDKKLGVFSNRFSSMTKDIPGVRTPVREILTSLLQTHQLTPAIEIRDFSRFPEF